MSRDSVKGTLSLNPTRNYTKAGESPTGVVQVIEDGLMVQRRRVYPSFSAAPSWAPDPIRRLVPVAPDRGRLVVPVGTGLLAFGIVRRDF